jgi:hypothetical protein
MDARTPGNDDANTKAASQIVCVLPAAGTAEAVEIVTVTGGQIVERVQVDASGTRHPRTLEGCSGWESAAWSADGQRIYLSSLYTCAAGLERRSTGVLAMAPGDQWLEVQGVTVGQQTTTLARRYRAIRPTTELANLPGEVATTLAEGQTLAARTARMAAAQPLTIDAVADAAQYLEAPVAEAWLVEQAQGFAVDAEQLLRLEAAGTPSGVIDLVVALSYPDVFAIDRTPHTTELTVAEVQRTTAPGNLLTPPFARYRDWDRFGYSGYYGYGSGLPYGYSPFGYGNYGYGWYAGGTPVIVVVRDTMKSETPTQKRGRVINGRGYTRGGVGDDGNARAGWPPANTGSAFPSNPGGGTGGAGMNPPSSSAGSNSDSGRRAKPRDPDRTGT